MRTKIESYIGFALKSGKCKKGSFAVGQLKRAALVILCPSISQNSLDKLYSTLKRLNCPVIKIKQPLENYVYKANVKVLAVLDQSLANAIIGCDGDYEKYQINENKD